jgi:hypothetical protein
MSKAEGLPPNRLNKEVAFNQLLARFNYAKDEFGVSLVLKGGYSLGMRFHKDARYTADMDFNLKSISEPTAQTVQEVLFNLAKKDMGDAFEYAVGTSLSADLTQATYAGWRYPVSVRFAGRRFTEFQLDVVIGNVVVSKPDQVKGQDILGYAGIDPVTFPLYPLDQQFAEKLHSYTFPRNLRVPSRTEDLVDMTLLVEKGMPDPKITYKAVKATFE